MESPNNGEEKFPTRHLSPSRDSPSAEMVLHLIELLVREPHGDPINTGKAKTATLFNKLRARPCC